MCKQPVDQLIQLVFPITFALGIFSPYTKKKMSCINLIAHSKLGRARPLNFIHLFRKHFFLLSSFIVEALAVMVYLHHLLGYT